MSSPNTTTEERIFKFQLLHGSVQLNGCRVANAALLARGVKLYIDRVVLPATSGSFPIWTDGMTIYIHTAESANGDAVPLLAWWSAERDPTVIDECIWVTHLDRYIDCIYVQRSESSRVEISRLKAAKHRFKLDTATTFQEAILNMRGRSGRPALFVVCNLPTQTMLPVGPHLRFHCRIGCQPFRHLGPRNSQFRTL